MNNMNILPFTICARSEMKAHCCAASNVRKKLNGVGKDHHWLRDQVKGGIGPTRECRFSANLSVTRVNTPSPGRGEVDWAGQGEAGRGRSEYVDCGSLISG